MMSIFRATILILRFKKAAILIVAVVIAFFCVAAWQTFGSRPARILFFAYYGEREAGPSSSRLRDELIECGTNAILPSIDYLRKFGPWNSRLADLPEVLKYFNGAAHEHLLRAIDSERDPVSRGYLIWTLQESFNDFSRLGLWIDDARRGEASRDSYYFVLSQVFIAYPDVPRFDDQQISKEFLLWWDKGGHQKRPGGSPLHPSKVDK